MKKFFLLISLFSCNSNQYNQASKIRYIDSIVHNQSEFVIQRVVTDTTQFKDDTIYTNYEYDKPPKLLRIYIEKTATTNKYISYFNNDTLIKIVVMNRNPNYSSDEVAAYYIDNDSVFHKIETRDKIEDIKNFILEQKRNLKYFNDSLTKKL
jgi:hypothetical protein